MNNYFSPIGRLDEVGLDVKRERDGDVRLDVNNVDLGPSKWSTEIDYVILLYPAVWNTLILIDKLLFNAQHIDET